MNFVNYDIFDEQSDDRSELGVVYMRYRHGNPITTRLFHRFLTVHMQVANLAPETDPATKLLQFPPISFPSIVQYLTLCVITVLN